MSDYGYICLDTEFINNISIIELSVFSIADRELYHRLFRPARNLKWTAPPDKLKITPEMVANEPTFREMLSEIQPMFDQARFIIGYAIDNDIKMLAKEGVKRLERIQTIEVRDLYWLVRGRSEGVDLYGVPSLLSITNSLGMAFEEGEAHFASSDTRAPLFCFHKLMEAFCAGIGLAYDPACPDEAIAAFFRELDIARRQYLREQAHGYAYLFKTERGYKYKVSRTLPERPAEICVEVADRSLADYDIMKQFARRAVPGDKGVFKLKGSDLDFFRSYTNVYDEDNAEMLRKLMRFKGRLSF